MKKIASFIAGIAMLATGLAVVGTPWILTDEPKTLNRFND